MKTVVFFASSLMLSGLVLASSEPHGSHNEHVSAFYNTNAKIKGFIDSAFAYVVYPEVAKGGFIIGGAGGDGFVYQGGRLVGTSKLSQVTIGAQIGGQVYSEIVLFEDEKTFNNFKEGNLQMSAQMSGVAVESGAALIAGYKNGVAIFIANMKGLMGEMSVGGQKLSFSPIKVNH